MLGAEEVLTFLGTAEYVEHKAKRFRQGDEPDLTKNEAFLLNDSAVRKRYERLYEEASLYFGPQPTFAEILARIHKYLSRL